MINWKSLKKFLLNFPLGMLIGTISSLSLAWFLDSNVAEIFKNFAPSIFSSLAALLAAALALAGVLANINNQNEIVEKNRIAKLRASRAVLPLTLSRVSRTCLEGFKAAESATQLRTDPEKSHKALELVQISTEDQKVIRDCIEVSDETSAVWLGLVLSHFQILRSRLERSLFDMDLIVDSSSAASAAVDWALVMGFIDHLFDFSRTGSPASVELYEGSVHIPHDFAIRSGGVEELHRKIKVLREYLENGGGWSAEAFIDRLSDPFGL